MIQKYLLYLIKPDLYFIGCLSIVLFLIPLLGRIDYFNYR